MDRHDLYDWLPGFEDVEDAEARDAEEARARARLAGRFDPLRDQLNRILGGGEEAPYAARARQRVQESYGQQGRGVLANAAQRGLLHSGQVAAQMRGLGSEQVRAEADVTNQANLGLVRSLLGQWQGEIGLSGQEFNIQQWFDQLDEDAKRTLLDQIFGGAAQGFGEEGGKAAAAKAFA